MDFRSISHVFVVFTVIYIAAIFMAVEKLLIPSIMSSYTGILIYIVFILLVLPALFLILHLIRLRKDDESSWAKILYYASVVVFAGFLGLFILPLAM